MTSDQLLEEAKQRLTWVG